jgi:predicted dehydrogenase
MASDGNGKRIRVGIAGQGRSGRDIHGRYLSRDPERYRIVAVADPLADRRERAAREYGCDTVPDYRDLLARDDLDLIVNALPSHLHVPGSLEMLERGGVAAVLCEKPLAARAADVDRLNDAAARSGRLLTVFQQWRFAPAFRKLREIIASGVLGRIVQVNLRMTGFARRWDWQTLRENHGGALLNTGPHPLDMALRLLDTDGMPAVFCVMDKATSLGDAEDHVKLILRADDRPLIDIEISSCRAYGEKTFTVYGTQGGLQGDAGRLDWRCFAPAEASAPSLITEPLSAPDGTPSYCRETLPWREQSWEAPANDGPDPAVAGYYAALHRTLAEGAPPEVTLPQIRQQITVIEECHRQNQPAGDPPR